MALLLPPLRDEENANVNVVFNVVEEVVAIMAAMMDAAAILRFIVSYNKGQSSEREHYFQGSWRGCIRCRINSRHRAGGAASLPISIISIAKSTTHPHHRLSLSSSSSIVIVIVALMPMPMHGDGRAMTAAARGGGWRDGVC